MDRVTTLTTERSLLAASASGSGSTAVSGSDRPCWLTRTAVSHRQAKDLCCRLLCGCGGVLACCCLCSDYYYYSVCCVHPWYLLRPPPTLPSSVQTVYILPIRRPEDYPGVSIWTDRVHTLTAAVLHYRLLLLYIQYSATEKIVTGFCRHK